MGAVKDRVTTDLTAAMKAGDVLSRETLRMALAALRNEEVAGKAARQLSDGEELAVLNREVAKRRDAAEAYLAGHRPELAAKENAEIEVLATYLPTPLTEAEVDAIVTGALAAVGAQLGAPATLKQMGLVMKTVTAEVAGRADGSQVAAKVKAALAAN